MANLKRSVTTLLTLGLLYGSAWLVASLFGSLYAAPVPMWMCVVLSLEMSVLLWVDRFGRGKFSVKRILGVVVLVCLVLSLGYGLYYAGVYLISYLVDGHVGGSFPWYTGFAFAAAFVGPVILVTGISWAVLHLRERKRNIKDIRLLTQLILLGTGLWAVIWTILRIRHILVYPNSYGYPWHATFVYTFLYFGIWMILEGCALFLLSHWEKKLTPEDLAEATDSVEPVPLREPIRWNLILQDGPVIAVPLGIVAVLMAWLWDSGYMLWNIAMVLFGALNVCLVIGLAAWMMYRMYGTSGIRGVHKVTWILTVLTPVAAVVWGIWYQSNCLHTMGSYASNLVYTLGLGFFGPIVLGECIVLVLLGRLERRIPGESQTEKGYVPWAVLAMAALVLMGQFANMDYRDEVNVTVSKVTNYTYDEDDAQRGIDHVVLTFTSDYDVTAIFDWKEDVKDDAIFFTAGTRWKPFAPIGSKTVGYSSYPEETVQYIYVYEPGAGYKLVLVRNEFTGEWEFYQ